MTLEEKLKCAFLSGFQISGEGWNGDYPFSDEGPLNDEDFVREMDECVQELLDA